MGGYLPQVKKMAQGRGRILTRVARVQDYIPPREFLKFVSLTAAGTPAGVVQGFSQVIGINCRRDSGGALHTGWVGG